MTYRVVPWDDTPRKSKKKTKPYGLCIHATGSTITVRALEKERDPNAYAADYYDTPGHAFPHDLVTWQWWNGDSYAALAKSIPMDPGPGPDVISIAPWWVRSHAQGLGPEAVRIYNGEHWDRFIKHKEEGYIDTGEHLDRYEWWVQKWGGRIYSPSSVFPGRDPNTALLSMEILVPVEAKKRGGYRRIPFTDRQHDVAAWRAVQMFQEYDWPLDELKQRVVGHEDIHPITRTDHRGPWDPGAGRYWDWELFFARFADHVKLADYRPEEPDSGPMEHD